MKTKFALLFTVGLLFAAAATQAQAPDYGRNAFRHDRIDRREDRRDGRFFEARRDRREMWDDRRDLRQDRREWRDDRRGWRDDRREQRDDRRDRWDY